MSSENFERGSGTTNTERHLARLAERSFLNLWSWPNVFIDKKVHEYRFYRIEFNNPQNVSLKLKVEDLLPSTKDPSVWKSLV